MPHVVYIRGDFGNDFGPGRSNPIRVDLKQLATVQGDTVRQILDEVHDTKGFLSRKGLAKIIGAHVDNPESAKALERTVWNLAGRFDDRKSILEAIEGDDPTIPISRDEFSRVEAVIDTLLAPSPAIERWQKADRVTRLTGVKIQDLQLVADMRPVFNDDRDSIGALVPIVLLRMVWENEAGLPEAIEAHLTSDQVSELSKKVQQLENKLDAIGTFIVGQQLDVPDLTQ